ncbi:metal-dependent amidase/aminoacylase/carboxypeptidase [Trichoderma sp. TUCIM 5745]
MNVADIVHCFAPDLAAFDSLYKDIHQYPDLSRFEARTASVIADYLRHLSPDIRVHNTIGGYGVVGVLNNGPGTVVMLRAELDALPIEEKTGLPYSSKQHMTDSWGREKPVMHACGHDMHMACLLAAAKLLVNARAEWSGTLILLFQPNEEHTGGAQAMVDDGLYDKIPTPNVVMAQHLMPIQSGAVSLKGGPVLVSADTVCIRIFGSEGHAANPQVSVDIISVASKIILRFPELEHDLGERGYVSIFPEQIHAGQPGLPWIEHADIVLDVKTYDPDLRVELLKRIKDIVNEEATLSGAKRKPEITSSTRAPLTSNDQQLTEKVGAAFKEFFGVDNVLEDVPSHPCEDFSILASAVKAPYLFWFLGRVDPGQLNRAHQTHRFLDEIPIEHSPINAPLIHPTLETGMNALSIAALLFLSICDAKL